MSGMSRKSGYDFCDENMPDALSRHEFLMLAEIGQTEITP